LTAQSTATNTVVISWPVSIGGYVLQQQTDVATGAWQNVATPVTQVGGQNQVVITSLAGNAFYRLSLP